jgi:glutathione S-transferase
MILFGHPFSSYTWKALIPLHEKELECDFRNVDPEFPDHGGQLAAAWPLGKFPVLVDAGQTIAESSVIIEHLDLHHPGARMIPADPVAALAVRFMDRIFDNHVMSPMQAIVNEHLPFITEQPDSARVARARAALDTSYAWLETRLATDGWAVGGSFTLADCAAAPALFYADWAHPIPEDHEWLRAYRTRLLARPSVARVIDEARPYRHYFPLGAPDRD